MHSPKYFDNNDFPTDYILNKNDIVITMTDLSKKGDTLGYSAKIPTIKNKKLLHNQRVGLVVFKDNLIHKDYLYMLMTTTLYQKFIVNHATGTNIKHTSPSKIESYNFLCPPLQEQETIADVLSSFDNYIETLQQQNTKLEQLATNIFNQIFTTNPQKHTWEEQTLGDISDIENGYAFKSKDFTSDKIPVIKIKNISNNKVTIDNNSTVSVNNIQKIHDKYKLKTYDIVMAMTGATIGKIGMVQLYSNDFYLLNQRVCSLRSNNNSQFFLWLLLHNMNFLKLIHAHYNGVAQPNISTSTIEKFPVVIPPHELLDEFNNKITPLFTKVSKNLSIIQKLKNQRDYLLPNLINGKIRTIPT